MKRICITLDEPVFDAGLQIADKRGFRRSFSSYVGWLIRRDAEGGVIRTEDEKESILRAIILRPRGRKGSTKRGK